MFSWLKQIFCDHDYQAPDSLRDFFGIIQCQNCGKWSMLPDSQMTTTTFNLKILQGGEDD